MQNRVSKITGLILIGILVALFSVPGVRNVSKAVVNGPYTLEVVMENGVPKAKATVRGGQFHGQPTVFNLAVYKMYDQSLETQEYFSGIDGFTVMPDETKSVTVALPPCMAQIDLYDNSEGPAPRHLSGDGTQYQSLLLWTFYLNDATGWQNARGQFCGQSTQPNLSVEKTGPGTVNQNQEITYTITAKNTGNGTAPGVSIADVFPASQLTFVRASDANCIFPTNGANIIACPAGDLAAGATRSVQFTFKVKAEVPCDTNITNKAEMGAAVHVASPWSMTTAKTPACQVPQLVCTPANQTVAVNQNVNFNTTGGTGTYAWAAVNGNPTFGSGVSFTTKYATSGTKNVIVTSGNQNATCNVTVTQPTPPPPPGECSLEISKSVDKTTANPYNELSYTLTFRNKGTANCTEVKVVDAIDSSLTYVRENHPTAISSVSFDSSSKVITWSAGTLIPNQVVVTTFVAKVANLGACVNRDIPNSAKITAKEQNNGQDYTVSNIVHTQVTTECPPPTLVCTPTTQSVSINQNASLSATGGTGTYAWAATNGSPSSGTGPAFATKYNTGGSKNVVVTSGAQTATCTVTVTQPTPPPPPGECKLQVNKSVNRTDAQPQDEVTYTVSFKNTGDKACTQVKGEDAIDSGLTYLRQTNSGQFVSVTYDQNNKVLSWNAGSLTPNQTAAITWVGKVAGFGACVDRTIPNTAKLTAAEYNNGQSFVNSNTVQTRVKTDCPPPTLLCTPLSQTANLNQNVTVSASGGTGSYTWQASGGEPSTGTGFSFTTKYASTGSKNVNVTSGSQHATCTVTVNQPATPSLSIEKVVRNLSTGTGFTHSVSAKPGDSVEYRITITNTGSGSVNDLSLADVVNNANILTSFSTLQLNRGFSGTLNNNGTITLGTLDSGNNVVATYRYVISPSLVSGTTVCNTATARGNNVGSVSDNACVTVGVVQSTNVVLNFSKKAWNDTKNADATTVLAGREDFITYTLTVRNTGNADSTNFVITDDLSGVLPLADMVDAGGGTVTNQVITYPAVTVPQGGSVSKQFRVRVKFHLASNISYVMTNTYGNTLQVTINTPKELVAPKTGGNTTAASAIGLGGLLTAGYALHRRKNLFKLIFS